MGAVSLVFVNARQFHDPVELTLLRLTCLKLLEPLHFLLLELAYHVLDFDHDGVDVRVSIDAWLLHIVLNQVVPRLVW